MNTRWMNHLSNSLFIDVALFLWMFVNRLLGQVKRKAYSNFWQWLNGDSYDDFLQ